MRSISNSPDANVTAGTANSIMKAMPSSDHTKAGMRLSVMPGARYLKIVTTKLIAPTVVEMPTNMTPSAQKSTLAPGEKALDVSGT